MYRYYLLFTLLISIQLEAVIVNAIKLKHPITGKIVYLFGDVHFKNKMDNEQLEFFKTFLYNNRESDIFLDSFSNSSYPLRDSVIPFLQDIHNETIDSERKKIQGGLEILVKSCGQNIGISTEQYNSIMKILDKISWSYLDILDISHLLLMIPNYICNKKLNIIPDIRFDDSKEIISARTELIQQKIPGILTENLSFLEKLNSNEKSLSVEELERLIIQESNSYMGFLDLDIIKHLADDNKKPLIAIVGALHVERLYPLLISEAFGYVIDREVKLEVIEGKTILRLVQEFMLKFRYIYLYNKFIDNSDFYAIAIKKHLNRIEKTGQIPTDFVQSFKEWRLFDSIDPAALESRIKHLVNEIKKEDKLVEPSSLVALENCVEKISLINNLFAEGSQDYYVAIKLKTVDECLKALEETEQIITGFIPGLKSAELEEFLLDTVANNNSRTCSIS